MRKTFLFARTDATIELDKDVSPDVALTIKTALDRTVIVTTPAMIGAGAILADKVITSLLLVANFEQVFVRFREGKKMPAFAMRRDPKRNLAELLPSSRALSREQGKPLASTPQPKTGRIGAIGDPLLVVNVATGVPLVHVASTLYATTLVERFEERMRINRQAPRGLIGGAVWDIDGRLTGLAIGERIPPSGDPTKRAFPSVYALSGEQVMDFADVS